MNEKKAAGERLNNKTNIKPDYTKPKKHVFVFYGGNAGLLQRRFISYLLDLCLDDFDRLSNVERLNRAGTDAIRQISKPYKNPLEYISKLRRMNGNDCLLTVQVPDCAISNQGSPPGYYLIPLHQRQLWRDALDRGRV